MIRSVQWTITGLVACLLAGPSFAASVILNEYNAVKDTGYLERGGTDSYFGRVLGNGGDWFELVVVEDVDMRDWSFVWANDDTEENTGTIFLSNDPFWQDMKAGTIITIIQSPAPSGMDTDETINHTTDWWVNICTEEEQAHYNASERWLARVYPSSDTGHFKADNDAWILTIYDNRDNVVFGPAGEGIYVENNKGISSSEVFYLYEDPGSSIMPNSIYDDGENSTFGAPNLSSKDPDEGEEPNIEENHVQDFSAFWGDPLTCEQALQRGFSVEGDLDNDCRVGLGDLMVLLDHWLNCNDPQITGCDHPWE